MKLKLAGNALYGPSEMRQAIFVEILFVFLAPIMNLFFPIQILIISFFRNGYCNSHIARATWDTKMAVPYIF